MRRITREGKGASVLPFKRALPPQRSLSCGVLEDGSGIFIECPERFRMTADQAEAFCVDLMGFIHELRNGGRVG